MLLADVAAADPCTAGIIKLTLDGQPDGITFASEHVVPCCCCWCTPHVVTWSACAALPPSPDADVAFCRAVAISSLLLHAKSTTEKTEALATIPVCQLDKIRINPKIVDDKQLEVRIYDIMLHG